MGLAFNIGCELSVGSLRGLQDRARRGRSFIASAFSGPVAVAAGARAPDPELGMRGR